jgi:hypothetical protein
VLFSHCWFESISATSIVRVYNYSPQIAAASTLRITDSNFVCTGNAPLVAEIQAPGSFHFDHNQVGIIPAGMKLSNDYAMVASCYGNDIISGPGAAGFLQGFNSTRFASGRELKDGAVDNGLANFSFQTGGAIAAERGILGKPVGVGTAWTTIARSLTGTGGRATVSGTAPGIGPFRFAKGWVGNVIQDADPAQDPFGGAAGLGVQFQVSGEELQMKIGSGNVPVFVTLIH